MVVDAWKKDIGAIIFRRHVGIHIVRLMQLVGQREASQHAGGPFAAKISRSHACDRATWHSDIAFWVLVHLTWRTVPPNVHDILIVAFVVEAHVACV